MSAVYYHKRLPSATPKKTYPLGHARANRAAIAGFPLAMGGGFCYATPTMRYVSRLSLAALCSLLAGCSLSKHVERVSDRVEKQYAATRIWDELPQRTISWEQALSLLRRSNLDLKQAQQTIDRAERERLNVYTDMIPSVSYYGYANKTIAELTRMWSREDVTQNVNVTFSLPTLTQIPYRVYAAEAHAYAAQKAKEGKERELESKLYQVLRKQELKARLSAHDERNGRPEGAEDPVQLLQRESDGHQYYAEIASLLGDYSARWNILPETMPHLRWEDYEPRLDKLDPLLVCQFAMKLEQARLSQYSVALRYLPTLNTSLYSPSLFSSTGGTYAGTFLDSRDTRLNMSISYKLDTQLTQWQQYRDSKDAYERAKGEVAAALIDHKDKVAALRRSMSDYNAWKGYMRKRMDYLRQAPAETATEFIARQKELADMERELIMQESKGIESEAALILEYGLPK